LASWFVKPIVKQAMRISTAVCLLAAPASALLATRPVSSTLTQRARLPLMQEAVPPTAADFELLRFENLKLKKEVERTSRTANRP